MGSVTTEKSKAAGAVVEEPTVPVQPGPADEQQLATAEAIAGALDPALVARLAAQARSQGVQLLGRGGVLQQLTRRFLEAALEAEMDEHLGYDKHDPVGRNGGNSRNGKRGKTLLTEVGPVDISVPGLVSASSGVNRRARSTNPRSTPPTKIGNVVASGR